MLTDQAYHLIVSVRACDSGATRYLSYALSNVYKRTDAGNDPLGEWAERNPGRHAIWVQWSALGGVQPGGETPGASALALSGMRTDRGRGGLERELLAGVGIALRIEDGYYGHGESRFNLAPKETTDGAQE